MTNFTGTWKLKTSENFEEYLHTLGVSHVTKKISTCSRPTVHISQDGDNFHIRVSSFRTAESNFTVGQEFEEDGPWQGLRLRSLVKWAGPGKLSCIQRPVSGEGQPIFWTREIVNGDLVLNLTFKNVSCSRVFAKTQETTL
ncbi:cellular retinoic acid-binding protein 1-like isoform X2 [Petromyzon marinus]|uniref:Cellular retinoic acid-binding protein 1-like n=2 Tax=Petromyzon marinus TaxID=7757 RepID=A0AAJ7TXL2_PETMA|nr:cellular retinoic acid-binding protein 1-like [Petromyzon marinus]